MIILGISAFVHDSAACLIKDGVLAANVEEERLNRIKHTEAFPLNAIQFVLKTGKVRLSDVDIIAFNWNPYKAAAAEIFKFIIAPLIYLQILKNSAPPKNIRSILASLRLKRTINKLFPGEFRGRIVWVDHHLAHAASSYYLSPFNRENADVLVVDGHGENCSTSVFSMTNGRFCLQWQAPTWDSLGILYTTFTNFLGFDIYQEGKTMALASFGRNTFSDAFRCIIGLKPDGRYTLLNKKYLGLWNFSETGLGKEFGRKRHRDEPLEQRHFDIACSMQNSIKETILHIIRHAGAASGNRHLCLSGGVFLNCDINKEILQSNSHEHTFVPPFPSDSGGAAGAALYAAHSLCQDPPDRYPYFSPYQGPAYSSTEILAAIQSRNLSYRQVDKPWLEAALALKNNKIIGWFQGRMECGPRALGNRSLLASPFSSEIKEYLNAEVKKREYFRPFAPIATIEAALKYFDQEPVSELTRYMLVTTSVKREYQDKLPGITHVDGTARIQIITREWNPAMYDLLLEFERLTGYAVLINTSFNFHEPIVCSPSDALECYCKAPIDALFMGNFMLSKQEAGVQAASAANRRL
ncbi:MAG TPA: carbamoyltransferase C-terminal domain-containing protein [Desulfuromonadaceae bacterium]|jgi:carbamoyltransferase